MAERAPQSALAQQAVGPELGRTQFARSISTPAPLRGKQSFRPQAAGNQALQRALGSRMLQAKLTVNRPGDTYEQEADRMADTVMRVPATEGEEKKQGLVHAMDAPASVQRMCHECAEEQKADVPAHSTVQRALSPQVPQAKLTVNPPGDMYEQAAGDTAQTVMRMPASERDKDKDTKGAPHAVDGYEMVQRACKQCEEERKDGPPGIQRMCSHCGKELEHPESVQAKEMQGAAPEVTRQTASRIRSLRGGGRALPVSVREFFESRIGHDFSNVRVHTDPDSTRDLQARAYTVGRNIVFGAGEYAPHSYEGKKLLAHELTHVIQQGAAEPRRVQKKPLPATSRVSDLVQRAADPKDIPPGFACPDDAKPSHPAGTDLLFANDATALTADHIKTLSAFAAAWKAAGGTDDLLVHGYASVDGPAGHNWTLSCDRALMVQGELIFLGIPPVRLDVVAHGPSTDFGAGAAPNRHAVIETTGRGLLPIAVGTLTARDNFVGRSRLRFGVGEIIDLNFLSIPARNAAEFGGLQWFLVSGGGGPLITPLPADGTGTYTAPPTAGTVKLELRVDSGATAGQVISAHTITIVEPNGVRMVAIPGTFPGFGGWATPAIPSGTWGAGFQANVFVDPKDVSFRGVVFGEGVVAPVVSGDFLNIYGSHTVNTFGPAHGGNATTGTAVSPPPDGHSLTRSPIGSVLGRPVCGESDINWAIPWEFSVAGSPRKEFDKANSHSISTIFCDAKTEKAHSGMFCRKIDGTVC